MMKEAKISYNVLVSILYSPILLYCAISIEMLVPRGQFNVMNALSQPVRRNCRNVSDSNAVKIYKRGLNQQKYFFYKKLLICINK